MPLRSAAQCNAPTLVLPFMYAWFLLGTIETCQSEVFEAQCSEDEVILMQVALFGWMEIGRCVESDLGYLGCKADVLPYLHR